MGEKFSELDLRDVGSRVQIWDKRLCWSPSVVTVVFSFLLAIGFSLILIFIISNVGEGKFCRKESVYACHDKIVKIMTLFSERAESDGGIFFLRRWNSWWEGKELEEDVYMDFSNYDRDKIPLNKRLEIIGKVEKRGTRIFKCVGDPRELFYGLDELTGEKLCMSETTIVVSSFRELISDYYEEPEKELEILKDFEVVGIIDFPPYAEKVSPPIKYWLVEDYEPGFVEGGIYLNATGKNQELIEKYFNEKKLVKISGDYIDSGVSKGEIYVKSVEVAD